MLVRAEKSVVDEIAVVARDVGGLPDRIQRLQLGVRHEAEGLSACLGVNGRAAQGHTDGRSRASDDLSATNAGHAGVPSLAVAQPRERPRCRPGTPVPVTRASTPKMDIGALRGGSIYLWQPTPEEN